MQQQVFRNTAFQVLAKLITVAFGLVTRKLLTNYLGPAGFGDYGLALAYAGFFSGVADWGTQLIGIREASRSPTSQSVIFGSVLTLRLLLSFAAFLLSLWLLPFLGLSGSLHTAFIFAGFLVVLFALKGSIGVIYDTQLRIDRWLPVEILTAVTTLGLVAVGISFRLSLPWFFISLIISTSLAILLAFLLSRKLSRITFSLNWAYLKHLGLESLPMGGVLVLYGFYNRIDTFILNRFAPAHIVGFYVLAYLIYENFSFFASYFTASVLPVLSKSTTLAQTQATFQKMYDLLIFTGLLASLGSFIAAPLLVTWLASASFHPATPLLRLLSFALFFSFLNHGTGYTFIALNRQRQYFWISLSALVINIVLNILFIPLYGAAAAAATTVITEITVQLLSLFLLFKSLSFVPSFLSFPTTVKQFIITRGKIF